MKRVHLFVAVVAVLTIVSCNSVTTEEILKKYETFGKVEGNLNKAGITIKVEDANPNVKIIIGYSNLKLGKSKENLELLANRYFIANASAPSKPLPVLGSEIISLREGDNPTDNFFYSITVEKSRKTRFLLVVFKGIDKSELEEFETQPLFFIVSVDDKNIQPDSQINIEILTKEPLLAGNLFDTHYATVNFIPNIGIFELENSPYAVWLGEIDKDEDGDITVSFYSDKIKGLDPNRRYLRMNGVIVGEEEPFAAEAIMGDRTIGTLGYNKGDGKITYIFNTKDVPDKFVIRSRNKQTTGDKIYFDSKTKNVHQIQPQNDAAYVATLIDDYNNSRQHVRLGEISKDKDGYTSVEFISEEFEKFMGFYGLPYLSEVIVNSKEVGVVKYVSDNGYMKYIYNTKEKPDKITIYHTIYKKSVFDGVTKKVIK